MLAVAFPDGLISAVYSHCLHSIEGFHSGCQGRYMALLQYFAMRGITYLSGKAVSSIPSVAHSSAEIL